MSEPVQRQDLKRIVVPLDGSPEAEQALPYAEAIAGTTGTGLTLVYVVSDHGNHRDPLGIYAREVQDAQEYLQLQSTRLTERGVGVETFMPRGDIAQRIAAEAKRRGASLIVMSTHGRSGLGRWLYGSVAERLLHTTQLPIMLVMAGHSAEVAEVFTSLPILLVPLDGSTLSEAALPVAHSLVKTLGGRLMLVRAVSPPSPALLNEWTALTYADAELEQQRVEAQEYLDRIARSFESDGVEVTGLAVVGPAPGVIQSLSQKCGAAAIVMATHGRTGLRRVTLGSVAHDVLVESGLPVVLVRPEEQSRTSTNVAIRPDDGPEKVEPPVGH